MFIVLQIVKVREMRGVRILCQLEDSPSQVMLSAWYRLQTELIDEERISVGDKICAFDCGVNILKGGMLNFTIETPFQYKVSDRRLKIT